MNMHGARKIDIGETLPLFDGLPAEAGRGQSPAANGPNPAGNGMRAAKVDRHMHAAWRLSKALKAGVRGRSSGRAMARLNRDQRHQVGNAICEHLLASLRQQVASEAAEEGN